MTGLAAEQSDLSDFRALYRGHHGFVWHALHRFGTDSAVLEDAVQDVFVVAYRRRSAFDGSSEKAWLYGIARRVASNYRRGDRRRAERQRSFRTSRSRGSSDGTREAIETLDRFVASLAEDDRELFILSELEGMTGPEIAQIRGRNVHTIYTRIRKLKMQFRAELCDLEQVRVQRPRASAGSWAALMPLLQPSVAPVVGWTAALSSTWFAVALGATAATGVLVVADRVLPETEPQAQTAAGVATSSEAVAGSAEESPIPREPALGSLATPASDESVQPPSGSALEAPASPRDPATPPSRESRPSRAPTQIESQPPTDGLAQENALLSRASTALRNGTPATTLKLTDEHAKSYRKSALSDLRTALRIEALCALGRTKQARGEATVFLDTRPQSPTAARIKKSCSTPQQKQPEPDNPGT